jgi:putative intracellular protease/amidase
MSASLPHLVRPLLGLLLATCLLPAQAKDRPKVLMVVSGEGRDEGRTRPGFEMDEFSQAYLIFRQNGLQVEVASPSGGAVVADKYNAAEPFNAQLLADAEGMRLLAQSRPTASLEPADYAAVYVVGGKGAMFDLPQDTALKTLLAAIYQQGGVVAAVCHGPAALADVKLDDGRLLVAGRAMTGFSNEEESVFGKRWAKEFGFLLEDKMRAHGARWEEARLMMPKVVVDGRLVTGQNPYSTTGVAEAIVRGLGKVPAARQPWRDEATMALVQDFLAGKADAARAALAGDRAAYHVELIGLLGYYQLQAGNDDAAVRDALGIMQLAEPYMAEPQFQLGIAEAQWRLGQVAQARAAAERILAEHPGLKDAATRLLVRMDQ